MTTVLSRMSLLGLLAIAGCASASDDGRTGGASLALHDDNGAWRAVPLGRDAPPLALRAEHAYTGALATRCGPGYSLDVIVDVGPVTSDFLQIDAVTVTFHAVAGATVLPRKLDVWSNLTPDKQVVDGDAKTPGESIRYDITRAYMLDPKDPIVVLELQSAGSIAQADLACRHTTRFVLYPQGAAVTVP